ncbi:MAG: glycosyltransferase, partial [Bryobacteraceae bacterium]
MVFLPAHQPSGAQAPGQTDGQVQSRPRLNPEAVRLKFAILGTRGIPARYGGFETFAEELSTRLVARGHQVIVYCRARHPEPRYRGVSLVYLPTIRHKYFETVVHTFLSTLHLLGQHADAALYCNAANAIFTWMPRAAGIPVALNVDGLERNRK